MSAVVYSEEFWEWANSKDEEWDDTWITHYETWCAAREDLMKELNLEAEGES